MIELLNDWMIKYLSIGIIIFICFDYNKDIFANVDLESVCRRMLKRKRNIERRYEDDFMR